MNLKRRYRNRFFSLGLASIFILLAFISITFPPLLGDEKRKDIRNFDELVAALKDNDPEIRRQAVVSLGNRGESQAVEFLIPMLRDKKMQIRANTATALGKLKDKRAVKPLLAILKDNSLGVGPWAASALGELGDKRAVKPLISMVNDRDFFIRWRVVEALGKLGDKQALKPLEEQLKIETNKKVKPAIIKALESLKANPHIQ